MCRLLGYVAERPTAVVDVLGEEGLESFTSLTAVHGDGWGMAWHDPADDSTRSASSAASAAVDPAYDELVRSELGAAGLVHLRWATGGLPVSEANTHPFIDGGYAFAHNGHVSPISRLEELLTPRSREALIGETDSERYFRFVLQTIEEHGDEAEGATRAIAQLVKEFPDCSLNALMLTPDRMFAIHINSRATSPLRALREMFDNEDEIPSRHTSEYFAMDYRVTPDAIHVISSGLDEPGWDPVPADTAVMVDLATRKVTRLDPLAAMQTE
ncbi:class II glutamine amidotransferase [Nocardioides sp.]|uniref:class II glutamine amidotransferase n=1 Tax=Nocardioides sp. TaxID=35761 RepID=UPI002732B9D1|nr:class II glutamine amidotransferase [Nocardioides sp.]MDP3889992.1 class II glutamine amidotransferase [Nocardioides sp.]